MACVKLPHRRNRLAIKGVKQMTHDEYVFKNATVIAERQIRSGRKLQSKEMARIFSGLVQALKDILIVWRGEPASE
jgi:hypothetical protein